MLLPPDQHPAYALQTTSFLRPEKGFGHSTFCTGDRSVQPLQGRRAGGNLPYVGVAILYYRGGVVGFLQCVGEGFSLHPGLDLVVINDQVYESLEGFGATENA